MRYVSTRGDAPIVDYTGALLAGLAFDGGLYVPESWPVLSDHQLEFCRDEPYHRCASEIIWLFAAGSAIKRPELDAICEAAYATFRDPEVVPTRSLGDDEHLLELFWGPTLSFKDVALQLLGRLFEHELTRTDDYVTIVGATSGDTGSAAIEACRDRAGIELVMLHPDGRVSDVQRRQMTTVTSANIHNMAVRGTFDDCQDMVKAMFADRPFREAVNLAAVNSINWARVSAQVVYYVRTAIRLGGGTPVSFTVPTGNFGNVLAAHIAKLMGAPIGRLVIASNSNDILNRTLDTGVMSMEGVVATSSPAMDIQVSSNFERLLFEFYGRDGEAIANDMTEFRSVGRLGLPDGVPKSLRGALAAGMATETQVIETIASMWNDHGLLVDPHTAVGLHVGRRSRLEGETMVYVATAHPSKFPDAVVEATGVEPDLPDHVKPILEMDERCLVVDQDLATVQSFVADLRS
ncbi:MAG: threonine synthase [Actinomycetia bacterium]|nr:threonine synthase [Actinomycetes bacterium]MCP4960687.1 threonine synthase [Actinomycetes bacterium]